MNGRNSQPNIWEALMASNKPELMTPMPEAPAPKAKVPFILPSVQPAAPKVDQMKLQSVSFPMGPTAEDKEYEAAIKERIAERQGGVEGMQKQIAELKAGGGGLSDVNIAPLLALTDSWMGSNLAQSYENPQAKRAEQIARLEAAMSKQNNEVTDDMIKLLADKSSNANARLMLDNFRQNRFEESLGLKKEDNIRKDVNKITDEYQTVQGQLNMAEQAVRDGDTRVVKMAVANIARNIGEQKGSLSDGDVQRSMPPDVATSVAELEAYLGSTAKISPELQGAFMNLINIARQKSNAIVQESLNRRKAQYSAGAYAPLMQQGQVGSVIFDEAMRPMTAPPTSPTAPQQKGGFMSFDEWKKNRGQ